MPFTTQQLTRGADYSLESYQKKEPIDQISIEHVTLDWLLRHKKPATFGNGAFKEPLYVQHGANYQNYFGPDQVTYNERDPAVWTEFNYFNFHDGFWFDEDRLRQAGIEINDEAEGIPTANEKETLLDLLAQSYGALRKGIQLNMAFELFRDGSQSTKACPGYESIIDPTPAVGTVGSINAADYTYWRNTANIGITAANVLVEMEETWAACILYGGKKPTKITCGRAYYDNFLLYSAAAVQRHQAVMGRKGTTLDASIEGANFKGVPVEWDPTLDALDTLLGTTTRTKTCYFQNEDAINLRPVKGHWMRKRRPERLPDRYVHYFGQTGSYSLTTNQRNSLAVITLA